MPPIPLDVVAQQFQQWTSSAMMVSRLVVLAATLYTSRWYYAQPYHTSKLTGIDWVNELILGHPERIYNELGMHLHVFVMLIIELRQMGYVDSRYVTLEEQLAIFLYSCRTGMGCRNIGERFQRSNDTITKYFRRSVASSRPPPSYDIKLQARIPPALAALHNFIIQHDPEDRVDPTIRYDPHPGVGRNDFDPNLHGRLATERYVPAETEEGKTLQRRIADAMWAQYQEVLAQGGPEEDIPDSDEEDPVDNGNDSGMNSSDDDDYGN
ncbi:putative transposase [Mycena indigotica]|uniref:Putative transposase n=1 Tax=Mycena indigotica TaxID=2126181 RepID=A0A8H6VZD4_9AGAR|nr:putative transposase [Mycena indigotica]KAF7297406.1 putative transposase [Mycena indigotica]